MQLSLVFRAVLLLFLLALILGVECDSSEKKSKRKGKSKRERKKKGLWVVQDSSPYNSSMSASLSPNRSLSPWTYETSFDDSRIPQKISEAKCEKRGCITEDGEEDLGLESKPIYYQINVLRRVKGKNKMYYALKLETISVSVGCTCVLPIVVPQN
ncbi:interleukin 17a/f3 [Pimephales promelas]|uniref:interleukin 17a/f3 n=1 Tax=Pimephales promelas TaxID=90988 RepID=UPI00195576B2|nr:interleukin 17a/f3 [Pimephales promelas]XP_039549260.1 interleukin 17a/f3 [Pimephales promelas]XP_039549261.1 interleukin 17a/f3 [Pimephales promelas]KAG1963687.1 interleukin-17B [Pimephales promelas]